MTSLLDIVPTVLEWYGIDYPNYTLQGVTVRLTGQSLLPLLSNSGSALLQNRNQVYGSHDLHEVTMFYPLRVIRTQQYKLIHNLNFKMPFPIDQDFYLSPTFQDILNRTHQGEQLPWYKTLRQYYYRPQWELYDLTQDSKEVVNLINNPAYAEILSYLQAVLVTWQNITADPWICAPGGVLEYQGLYQNHPQCLPLYNDLDESLTEPKENHWYN